MSYILYVLLSGLTEEEAEALAAMKTEKLKDDADASKGFVISFDDDTPKKPKPMLKQRRMSNKKNSIVSEMSSDGSNSSRKENVPPEVMICIVSFWIIHRQSSVKTNDIQQFNPYCSSR